jgi:hypothetical protein
MNTSFLIDSNLFSQFLKAERTGSPVLSLNILGDFSFV